MIIKTKEETPEQIKKRLTAERQSRFRQRKLDQGYVQVNVLARKKHKRDIEEYAAALEILEPTNNKV